MGIRERIQEAIDASAELTVRSVSLRAGLSDSALNKFLTHQTKSITVDNLEKIAEALGVSLRWLMFGDPEVENVSYIWDHIPERRRKQALQVLQTFAEDGPDAADGAA